MTIELVGAGFGRTGTLSLKHALEALGVGPCHHMMEVMLHPGSERGWYRASLGESTDWSELLSGYRSLVDWPGCRFWREISTAFPDAPVLLSIRDPERWYESAHETIYQAVRRACESEDPAVRERMKMPDKVVFQDTFAGRFEDRAFAIGVFEAHNEEVRRTIPAERLLVYQVSEGWEPLCRMLGRPIPEIAFPHVNSRDEFQAMVAARASGSAP